MGLEGASTAQIRFEMAVMIQAAKQYIDKDDRQRQSESLEGKGSWNLQM